MSKNTSKYQLPKAYENVDTESRLENVKPHEFIFRNVQIDDGVDRGVDDTSRWNQAQDEIVDVRVPEGTRPFSRREIGVFTGIAALAITGLILYGPPSHRNETIPHGQIDPQDQTHDIPNLDAHPTPGQ